MEWLARLSRAKSIPENVSKQFYQVPKKCHVLLEWPLKECWKQYPLGSDITFGWLGFWWVSVILFKSRLFSLHCAIFLEFETSQNKSENVLVMDCL